MSDGLTYQMEASLVLAALASLGDQAQPFVNDASHETADAIVAEARARLHRQLSAKATGATENAIVDRAAFDGNGFVVVVEREPLPALPLWLEKGTKGKHKQEARPYFYAAGQLEEGPHLHRIELALEEALRASGMGD